MSTEQDHKQQDHKQKDQCQGRRKVEESVYVQESRITTREPAKSNFDAKLDDALNKVNG